MGVERLRTFSVVSSVDHHEHDRHDVRGAPPPDTGYVYDDECAASMFNEADLASLRCDLGLALWHAGDVAAAKAELLRALALWRAPMLSRNARVCVTCPPACALPVSPPGAPALAAAAHASPRNADACFLLPHRPTMCELAARWWRGLPRVEFQAASESDAEQIAAAYDALCYMAAQRLARRERR